MKIFFLQKYDNKRPAKQKTIKKCLQRERIWIKWKARELSGCNFCRGFLMSFYVFMSVIWDTEVDLVFFKFTLNKQEENGINKENLSSICPQPFIRTQTCAHCVHGRKNIMHPRNLYDLTQLLTPFPSQISTSPFVEG